ncbi:MULTISPECIES: ChaN family lipoprotein [unclassified Leeuwenhoekiella]|uniref:ChaN family lipoprotein n=1 Tax=unclassified Leeuwenhoekiella TaxID=2615029 RepID=UPI000C65BC04|nr:MULTISPECIES: ChaN family lipoprotein [unclassified Leeuwenhoekiella]MAW93994.1 iron-regulated protein [Leeuwenhoekiella sp.]MBA80967.1 iron-regulated protein [Leeuwenhoekiella sp.]|tara:strand:+ start:5020 stop:5877 length:858 start_codon:yes stop_codon:yes gene_type:complete
MIRLILFTIAGFLSLQISGQDKPAYRIFDANGNPISYSVMLDSLKTQADVILFGELHNNPIAHWLELELAKDLSASRNLTLGAEMIETDNQEALSLYLKDSIDYKQLSERARLWNNHKTDYQPLVTFAKQNKTDFIATNVPRRYAAQVHQHGLETLDSIAPEEKQWIAPLPIAFDADLPRYQEILKMMGDHGSPKLVMAQALKDATMAHSILQNRGENGLFLHFNGAFHSDFHEGILWYLKLQQPDLNYFTLSTVLQDELFNLDDEHLNRADFIIVVDADMTSTY